VRSSVLSHLLSTVFMIYMSAVSCTCMTTFQIIIILVCFLLPLPLQSTSSGIVHSFNLLPTATPAFTAITRSRSSFMMAANGRYISTPDDQPRRPNDNTYWVVNDKFIAGEYPTDRSVREEASMEKLRKYLDLGINYFVDLTQNGEKEPYEQMLKKIAKEKEAKVSYQRLPIQDFGIPTKQEMKQILDTIDGAIADGKTVYVHCRGGIGRTGTTVGCFLARNGN